MLRFRITHVACQGRGAAIPLSERTLHHHVARLLRSRTVGSCNATDVPECTEAMQTAMPIPGGATNNSSSA